MTFQSRSILDQELAKVRDNILRLTSMVDTAIDQAMTALRGRDVVLAQNVMVADNEINHLRYKIEEECLRILATQAPTATDLRTVVAAIHVAVELERVGDYASGIARLVARMEEEAEIDTLHKLPKMAKRARQMVQDSIQAYVDRDAELAHVLIKQDDKIDKQYNKLFRETLQEMQDDDYIRRATFLLWAGHNLERMGDRATNIAERVIFMLTGEYVEITSDVD